MITSLNPLRKHRTLTLILLSKITGDIYLGHYVRRQTRIMNDIIPETDTEDMTLLSGSQNNLNVLAKLIFFSNYLLAAGLIIFLVLIAILPDNHIALNMMGLLLNLTAKMSYALGIGWSFMARNRMNTFLKTKPEDPHYFHVLWTLLFGIFYFNFKINRLTQPSTMS